MDGLYNWNGEGKDYILAYRRGGGVKPALYDGWGNTAVSFPEDGYVLHGDLFGRDKAVSDTHLVTPPSGL